MYGMIAHKFAISFGHVMIVIMTVLGQEDIATLSAKLKTKELNNGTTIPKLEEFIMGKYQIITWITIEESFSLPKKIPLVRYLNSSQRNQWVGTMTKRKMFTTDMGDYTAIVGTFGALKEHTYLKTGVEVMMR